jgi:hypothetical protein
MEAEAGCRLSFVIFVAQDTRCRSLLFLAREMRNEMAKGKRRFAFKS